MKLVLATPLYPPDPGGPSTYAKGLEEEFNRRGIETQVVTYSRIERALPIGLRHLVYGFRLLPRTRGARAILALDTWSVGIPALCVAKLSGKSLLLRVSGDFLWESYIARTGEQILLSQFYETPRTLSFKETLVRSGTNLLLQSADAILFNTAWQRALWQRAYHFPPSRAHVVGNYFPNEREYSEPHGRIFVAADRPHPLKNHPLLERVFARVKKDFPDIELDTRVLAPSEHAKRNRESYALVIASVSEVNPNTAANAIRYGKPFICTRDCGAYERLKEVGMFVDTRSEEALEKALRALLDPMAYGVAQERLQAFNFSRSWSEVANDILHFVP